MLNPAVSFARSHVCVKCKWVHRVTEIGSVWKCQKGRKDPLTGELSTYCRDKNPDRRCGDFEISRKRA